MANAVAKWISGAALILAMSPMMGVVGCDDAADAAVDGGAGGEGGAGGAGGAGGEGGEGGEGGAGGAGGDGGAGGAGGEGGDIGFDHLPANIQAIEWVPLAAGVFEMGSAEDVGNFNERPLRTVTVPAFRLMKTQVTVDQYLGCVEAGACAAAGTEVGCNAGVEGRADHPINCVSWDDAAAFVAWVGSGVRLPSEAEWEYAARSQGLPDEYPWGNELPTCERVVMVEGNSGCGENQTAPVCSKSPLGDSAQGVCDLAGNVFEWVADWAGDYADAPVDGSPHAVPSPRRSARGGSWNFPAGNLRARYRFGGTPDRRATDTGFRLAWRAEVPVE